MIKVGRYDVVKDDITAENFPVSGEGQAEKGIVLMPFDQSMTREDVIVRLDELGLRPAKIEELLAFGATYPEEQRRYMILALGSVCVGSACYYYSPALGDDWSALRSLRLVWFEYVSDNGYRFAAVRK